MLAWLETNHEGLSMAKLMGGTVTWRAVGHVGGQAELASAHKGVWERSGQAGGSWDHLGGQGDLALGKQGAMTAATEGRSQSRPPQGGTSPGSGDPLM